VAVIAGAHPDEPVGTSTALHLAEQLQSNPALAPLRERITFHAVPMANPDGSQRNHGWFSQWMKGPELGVYLRNVRRDTPDQDVEFGFPRFKGDVVRPENAAIARWFDSLGTLNHYVSLHSMFLGGGALLLVAADDVGQAMPMLENVLEVAKKKGLTLHDKDRFGQKGFSRLAPGLQSAPTASAMREFFEAGGRSDVADNFRASSMQYVQEHNGAPVALVSEIPLVFDPRLSSMKRVGRSRAKEEERFARGIEKTLTEASGWADTMAGLKLPGVTAVADLAGRVAAFRKRIDAGVATVAAMRGDFARYGEAEATEGVVLENDLNLRRRRIALLGQAGQVMAGFGGAEVERLRANFEGQQTSELAEIAEQFDLRFPSVATQMEIQLASILAGVGRG
jgi:hypothetical protein